MSSPIAIIDCAIKEPSYNCMNKIVEQFNIPFTYHWVSAHGLESLNFANEASGYIIFGSDSNVCDRLDWQVELSKLMKEKILKGIPTLGICFGHQLMADAFGANVDLVTEDNKCFEGVRSHKVLNTHLGFNEGETLSTFITHHYEVKDLPKDFIHLSTSKDCFYDGLAHKDLPYFSFQGHPEASMHFAKSHLEIELPEDEYKKGLTGGAHIISTFLDLCKKNSN